VFAQEVEQRNPSVGGNRRLAAVDDHRHGDPPFSELMEAATLATYPRSHS
jgi:hypothetical protein